MANCTWPMWLSVIKSAEIIGHKENFSNFVIVHRHGERVCFWGDGHPTCVEICAGAGGQALGLELAGFRHLALVEIEKEYCKTLLCNHPEWNVINRDVKSFDGTPYKDAGLFAGGVPCPPFSVAGKQSGENDERDLFPEALRLIREIDPKAVMLENVRGIFDKCFDDYRTRIRTSLEDLGYRVYWELLNASDYEFRAPTKTKSHPDSHQKGNWQ